MEALKRRLESLREEEKALHRQSRARVNYLQELYEIPCVADVKYDEWSKVRLNRLMVDYLLRSGYTDSASSLAKRMGIEDLVDSEAFMQCHRIQASLDKHRTQECLSWCADNKQALKKEKVCITYPHRSNLVLIIDYEQSELEFELRLQQYLELVRTQQPLKLLEATRHARKYFSSHPNSIFAVRAAGLLAYSPNTTVEPYRTLYSSSRWETLKELFVNTYEKLLSLPQQTPLHHALSAGLSALKTPACHSTHLSSSSNANTASGTSVCPICSTELNELARGVPYAHHSKSNVESDPVVLPNGRVYGKERLLNWQGKAVKVEGNGDSWIRDPTNPEEVYEVQQMKKIYFT